MWIMGVSRLWSFVYSINKRQIPAKNQSFSWEWKLFFIKATVTVGQDFWKNTHRFEVSLTTTSK